MTRDEMIEVMARAIETESNLRRYGLYDYTGYSSSYAPHVVRNEDDRSVILRSHSAEEANGHYEQLNRSRLALAALSALEAAGYVVVKKAAAAEALTMMTDGSAVSQWVVDDFVDAFASQQEKTDG